MGDYETKQEAVRLATEAAKRDVLKQVATYVDSMTVAKGLAIVKDEIRSYAAGVITVMVGWTDQLLLCTSKSTF